MELVQLREWFIRYKDFWPLWKNYKFNGLANNEIIAIEIYMEHDFAFNTNKLGMFHAKEEITERLVTSLVTKFQNNYKEYKEWITNRFQGFLFKSALYYGFGEFFETPINSLQIDNVIKEN